MGPPMMRRMLVFIVAAFGGMWLLGSCAFTSGVAGTITASGVAHAGIEVAIFAAGTTTEPLMIVATGADGTFRSGIGAGLYDLRIGQNTWRSNITVAASSFTPIDADITLQTGGIHGVVTDENSTLPLEAVTVTAITRDVNVDTRITDATGVFVFDAASLPVGAYTLKFERLGYATRWATGADGPLTATLFSVDSNTVISNANGALSPSPRNLTGRITNGYDAIPNTVVVAYLDATPVAIAATNASGDFQFGNLNPGAYRLIAAPPTPYRAEAFGTRSDPTIANGTVFDLTTADVDTGPNIVAVCDPAHYQPNAPLPGTDHANADLRGCDLRGMTVALNTGLNLVGANLRGANLSGSNLDGAEFALADLQGTDLRDTVLTPHRLRFAKMADALLDGVLSCGSSNAFLVPTDPPESLPAGWKLIKNCFVGPRSHLESADLTGADLYGANITGAFLPNYFGHLKSVRSGALIGLPASLPVGVVVANGYLVGEFTVLTNADLRSTDLTGARFTASITAESVRTFAGLRSGGITWASSGGVQPPWFFHNGHILVAGTNLDGADLRGARVGDLSNTSMVGANLDNANLEFANLSGSMLTGATMRNVTGLTTWFHGNFQNADLRDVDFTGSTIGGNFTGAALAGSTWTDVRLEGFANGAVDLSQANFLRVTPSAGFYPALLLLPPDWQAFESVIVGPTVVLHNQEVSNVDLSGTNLSQADLRRTRFSFANLSNADLSSAQIDEYTNFGPGTPLNGAQMPASLPRWFVFRYTSAIGTDFTQTNLTNVIFEAVNLTGALAPADGSASLALFSPFTTCPDGYVVVEGGAGRCTGHGAGW